ncbi:unnamed protein product [Lathyrus oleraceus]
MGKLVKTIFKWYVNGEVTEMNWCWDVDYISYMKLEDVIKREGYINIKCLWHWNPAYNFYRGLRPLNNDQDVLKFSKDVVGYDVIYVYVEHSVGIPEIVDDSEVDANIKDDGEVDIQCIRFKSVDVTKEGGELDANIEVGGEETPNGVAEEVTTDHNVVAKEVTNDANVNVNNEIGQ